MPLRSFHPVIQTWFTETFGQPSPPQAQGWPVIARGESALILAPTGSGKTLAAFLKCLDELYKAPGEGVQVLYISPLKALNNDVAKNLERPLRELAAKAEAMGVSLPTLTTGVRTGDTPQSVRTAMRKRPPHILITTPESLYLMLTSQARTILRTVRYVIVDEIHAVCGTKRGVHLSLSLERLEAILERPPVRIGLSATQRPLDEVARFLGGVGRPVTIIDTGTRKELDLRIEVPLEDMRALPDNTIWAAVVPRLLELVREHRSTLIFVNYRGLAERLAQRLNDQAGEELAKVHHGSMSREAREQVEAALKAGRLPCLVATSSLELGIDIGAIDLVVQVESPKSVAAGLQRVGRAGHILGVTSKGRLLPKFRGDLVETACIVREMLHGRVEETRILTGALDVLAQQVTAMVAMDDWRVTDLIALLRRSYCYRDLTDRQLHAVLEMLAGRYPADEFRDLRPRITWDQENSIVRARPGAKFLAIRSGGTIPDRGYYGVYIQGTSVKLGEMDEEFVFESRPGDVFLLGTATWRIQAIEHDRITVTDAFGAMPRMPFWKGESIGRTYAMGVQVGRFVAEVGARLESPTVEAWLQAECHLDDRAALNLTTYLRDQAEALGALPTDRHLMVEYFWDETGDRRVVIHSPFGGRVHLALMVVLKQRLRQLLDLEVEMLQTDDGILLRLPGAETPPPLAQLLQVTPADAERMLLEEIGNTAVFGAYFRMNAGRALILPKPRPGRRQALWLQRLRAADLLQVARKYEDFPILLETYREVLRDVLDMDGLCQVLASIQSGAIAVQVVETSTPSPMAAAVMMGFVGAYMYEGDTPKAERRGALLGINRDLLREILGAEQLRELLDERAIVAVHDRLQRLQVAWHPRTPDEAADLLRRLGDLTAVELRERGVDLDWLQGEPLQIAGEARYVAPDDRRLYGDLMGNAGAIIRRYALNHGPFQVSDLVARYGYGRETVERYLAVLQAEGLLAAGEYTKGVAGREFCDVEVLQQIHRQTMALLRREIEPVDGATFARFLLQWQGLEQGGARPARGGAVPHALRRALAQLQGLPLPAEVWEREVLPARVPGYQPLWLDTLSATGELHWAMLPSGKLSFYLPEQMGVFAGRLLAESNPLTPEQQTVVEALERSGADFLGGVARASRLLPTVALEALWALMRLGLVTNDTCAPMRVKAPKGRPIPLRGATGRWSLTARLVGPVGDPAAAVVRILLERYGVVMREVVQSEESPITWSEALAVLKRMELRGQVRQGYFVAALGGAQFALPEAVERLRAARGGAEPARPHDAPAYRLVAAVDPANPYGSILAAPAGVRRLPSNYLVLEAGEPVLLLETGAKRLVPLGELTGERLSLAVGALQSLPRAHRRITVTRWGDEPIHGTTGESVLQKLGFERTPTGLILYL